MASRAPTIKTPIEFSLSEVNSDKTAGHTPTFFMRSIYFLRIKSTDPQEKNSLRASFI
jgi:hypothetical protein